MEGPICPAGTRLIETLKWDGGQLVRRDRHLARLRESAAALGFGHDAQAIAAALGGIGGTDPFRVRLTLGMSGDIDITTAPFAASAPYWNLVLSGDRVSSDDPFLRHKTTQRAIYDETRAALGLGVDEVIFANERGEICEGAITSIFFDLGQGLSTPPLRCGCLPGILRGELLDSNACVESILHIGDLGRAKLWIGNSLRGLISARISS